MRRFHRYGIAITKLPVSGMRALARFILPRFFITAFFFPPSSSPRDSLAARFPFAKQKRTMDFYGQLVFRWLVQCPLCVFLMGPRPPGDRLTPRVFFPIPQEAWDAAGVGDTLTQGAVSGPRKYTAGRGREVKVTSWARWSLTLGAGC